MTRTAITVDRLRNAREIAAVLRARQQRAGRLLVLYGRQRAADGPARIAVVASRKVGGSVVRNRAKRLLREAAHRIDWCPGWDLVLVARGAAAGSDLQHVASDLRELALAIGAIEPGKP